MMRWVGQGRKRTQKRREGADGVGQTKLNLKKGIGRERYVQEGGWRENGFQ